MDRPKFEVADVFRRYGVAYRLQHGAWLSVVSYHPDHVGRLMHSLNWSHQKPETRAVERDEEAIEHWKRKDWPRVKKTLRGWAPTSYSPTNPDSC